MRVHVKELQEGCILTEDVFSLTNRPIVPKNTILTYELIQFLQAFLVKDVKVSKTLVSGQLFIPENFVEEEEEKTEQKQEDAELTFSDLFLQAANLYRKEFQSWQAGMTVDVAKVRAIIVPLLHELEKAPLEILTLHHLSTEKEYLYQHSIAVGLISWFIGKKLNYKKGDLIQLALAGCLSDCGMAKVPESVLNKKGTLTSNEYNEIKNHPTHSYNLIKNSTLIRDVGKVAVFQHHERLDGTGYPIGDKVHKIHPFALIIAVADTFHAMTSARLYRKKQSPFKVMEMILQDNFGKFDISVIKALQSGIINFSIGTKVKLSNGTIAEILFFEEKSPTRPLIKLLETEEIISLEKNREIFIEEVL
ncbi:HD-GYP domain-containing protein [Bacillus dakarensis]|uniref:HD-GYP domain-containing protein n=1 Tax=Robertmurraya dakarensis TaxID=1926278 RepID=UPI00098256A0|nr:HD-GYP domain-containing protein [Bacillus dakarensis]